ncbi:GNAT family N-acetyltransferase [Streptomyces sp. NPDC048018]|uniref:GNAT family N-acetyltransferase n=1 Tax=Streptomyces sp. NPDC048018 TaxID=3365499 RepID=UPI003713AC24
MPLRRALPADAAALAAVHVRSWQAAYRGLVPDTCLDGLDVAERARVWRERLTAPGAPVVTVVEDEAGAVTAFSSFRAWPADDEPAGGAGEAEGEGEGGHLVASVTAELSTLYAVPEAWGRGVGRALLAATVDAMREAGFREAGLWVFEENARARAFYERAGWHPDGATATDDTGGRLLTELRYRVSLFAESSPTS